MNSFIDLTFFWISDYCWYKFMKFHTTKNLHKWNNAYLFALHGDVQISNRFNVKTFFSLLDFVVEYEAEIIGFPIETVVIQCCFIILV